MGITAAWIVMAGTLGGVLITATFGLLTAHLSQRWHTRNAEREQRFKTQSELHLARRQVYTRYIVSAQRLFDKVVELHAANRHNPLEKNTLALRPPAELGELVAANESCRVEVLLLAGAHVERAITEYNDALNVFWRQKASGDSESVADSREHAAYQALISKMRTRLCRLPIEDLRMCQYVFGTSRSGTIFWVVQPPHRHQHALAQQVFRTPHLVRHQHGVPYSGN